MIAGLGGDMVYQLVITMKNHINRETKKAFERAEVQTRKHKFEKARDKFELVLGVGT